MLGQLLRLGEQSRPDVCVGVSPAAQRLGKATLANVKALIKWVDQERGTAEMGLNIPCGLMNLKTCAVMCCAEPAFANAEEEKSQCGLVVGLTRHPELVKTGRFDLSTITSWQSTTISSMFQASLDRSAHGSQLSD